MDQADTTAKPPRKYMVRTGNKWGRETTPVSDAADGQPGGNPHLALLSDEQGELSSQSPEALIPIIPLLLVEEEVPPSLAPAATRPTNREFVPLPPFNVSHGGPTVGSGRTFQPKPSTPTPPPSDVKLEPLSPLVVPPISISAVREKPLSSGSAASNETTRPEFEREVSIENSEPSGAAAVDDLMAELQCLLQEKLCVDSEELLQRAIDVVQDAAFEAERTKELRKKYGVDFSYKNISFSNLTRSDIKARLGTSVPDNPMDPEDFLKVLEEAETMQGVSYDSALWPHEAFAKFLDELSTSRYPRSEAYTRELTSGLFSLLAGNLRVISRVPVLFHELLLAIKPSHKEPKAANGNNGGADIKTETRASDREDELGVSVKKEILESEGLGDGLQSSLETLSVFIRHEKTETSLSGRADNVFLNAGPNPGNRGPRLTVETLIDRGIKNFKELSKLLEDDDFIVCFEWKEANESIVAHLSQVIGEAIVILTLCPQLYNVPFCLANGGSWIFGLLTKEKDDGNKYRVHLSSILNLRHHDVRTDYHTICRALAQWASPGKEQGLQKAFEKLSSRDSQNS